MLFTKCMITCAFAALTLADSFVTERYTSTSVTCTTSYGASMVASPLKTTTETRTTNVSPSTTTSTYTPTITVTPSPITSTFTTRTTVRNFSESFFFFHSRSCSFPRETRYGIRATIFSLPEDVLRVLFYIQKEMLTLSIAQVTTTITASPVTEVYSTTSTVTTTATDTIIVPSTPAVAEIIMTTITSIAPTSTVFTAVVSADVSAGVAVDGAVSKRFEARNRLSVRNIPQRVDCNHKPRDLA